MTRPDVARYLDLAWKTEVLAENLSDGTPIYVAKHPELRGCMAQASTPEEAVAELREVREAFLAVMIDAGVPVPAPAGEPEAVAAA